LLSQRGGERFVDRVTFPISDRRGRIVGFGARALGDTKPKYLNSPETDLFNKRSLLYGFPQVAEAVRKEEAALVVEGYTDVLMLYQSGIKNAVATLGTAMTEQHLKTLSGHADRIYLLFDPDEAGEKVLGNAFFTATELKLDLQVLRLPQDPADWLLEHSAGEFLDLLSGATSVLEYGIRRATDQARGAGAVGRARALPKIKDLVRRIENPILSREALRLAAEALGMDPEALREDLGVSNDTSRSSPHKTPRRAPSDPLVEAGREVLALALAHPHLTERLLEQGVQASGLPKPVRLEANDFGDEAQGHVFQILQEHPGKGSDAVLSDERTRPYLDLVSVLALEGSKSVLSTDRRKRGQEIALSEADAEEAWLRLLILSREQAKSLAEDYDAKERLRAEIVVLKAAQHQISTRYVP
jgi:DNA primase